MRKVGYTITTAERHFLTRCEIKQEGKAFYLDTSFEKDVVNSLTVKKLSQIAEIKKKLKAAHPGLKLWAVELFNDDDKAYCRSTSDEAPPWFTTPHAVNSGLFAV
jgi:hypothetical protein